MAEKSSLSMKDVDSSGTSSLTLRQAKQLYSQDPTNQDALKFYVGYLQAKGLGRNEISALLANKRPDEILGIMDTDLRAEDSKLAQAVDQNLSSTISGISNDNLEQIVVSMPDKNKKFLDVNAALAKGDLKSLRNAYAETFDVASWKEFVGKADDSFIKQYAGRYNELKQEEFLKQKGLYEVKEEKGKKTLVLNVDKAREYVSSTARSLDDKKKALVFPDLGVAYIQTKAEKEAKKKKSA